MSPIPRTLLLCATLVLPCKAAFSAFFFDDAKTTEDLPGEGLAISLVDPTELPPALSLRAFKMPKEGTDWNPFWSEEEAPQMEKYRWVWIPGKEEEEVSVAETVPSPPPPPSETPKEHPTQVVSSGEPASAPIPSLKELWQRICDLVRPQKIRVRLTFYSGHDDQWGSRVAWGKVVHAERGRTVAADPTIFPFGTWIEVPGLGILRVEDTGSAVKTRKASGGKDPVIDIYVGNDEEAMKLARTMPEYVEVIKL